MVSTAHPYIEPRVKISQAILPVLLHILMEEQEQFYLTFHGNSKVEVQKIYMTIKRRLIL